MIQDNKGFIWIGTTNGIYIFDGIEPKSIKLPDSIVQRNVSSLFADRNNNIWIGLENGIVLRYLGFGKFEVMDSYYQNTTRITSFAEDNSGTIWVGTYGQGIIKHFNDSSKIINSDSGLSDNYIYTMLLDDSGKLWMGTDNGLTVLDTESSELSLETISVEDGLPDFIVQSLEKDDSGNIWIGMYDMGICYYNPGDKRFYVPEFSQTWPHGPVNALFAMGDRLWIASGNAGIVEYVYKSKSINNYQENQTRNIFRIKSFLKDKEGNKWVMAYDKIHLSMAGIIEFIKQDYAPEIINIHAMTIDSSDRLWFANDHGLFSYSEEAISENDKIKKYNILEESGDQEIMSLYMDKLGILWIGTFGQGIIRLDPKTGQQKLITEKDGLVNGNVLSIAGNNNEIWFGTLGGASLIQSDDWLSDINHIPEFENFGKKEGLANNYIYQVYLSPEGIPYFATDGNGVLVYKESKFESISQTDNFSDKVIYSICSDQSGNIWMNAAEDGLYKSDGTNIVKVTKDPDHNNLSFNSIVSHSGKVIMVYDHGIDILDVSTNNIQHFEENAGLDNIKPDLNTAVIDSKKNVWIGTSKGIIKYRLPESDVWESPVTQLSTVSLFLEAVEHLKVNSFTYAQNHLSFEYSGLWYQYPEKVEYLCKLEGHDIDWIRTKNTRIIYSNLKPGKYVFKVKSGIYDNFSNAVPAEYFFEISKPFWKNRWFIFTLLIITGILIYLLIRQRENRLKKEQELIHEKIKFQFENLKSQINPHFLFNSFSTLIALIESDSNEAVDYVEELSTLFRNILEYKDHDLIALDAELEVANNYLNLQKKRFGKNLIIDIQDLDAFSDLRIPPLTLQLLIENAIKHNVVSTDNPLTIHISINTEKERIFVRNNLQPKLDTESTGVGINNISNRYRLLTDRNIEITETDTEYIVGIPFMTKA